MSSFKFVEKKNLWFLISLSVILLGTILMIGRGLKSQPILNYGIDFVGGNSFILKFQTLEDRYIKDPENKKKINTNFMTELRASLTDFGLEKSTIQISQNGEVIIKTLELKKETSQKVISHLEQTFNSIEILEIDFIGPSIGEELKQKSIWIIITVFLSLLVYITLRFKVYYAYSALIAITHDALIVISIASLFNIEINTNFIAALLTILGYSINDTIVIFDRIRENFFKLKEKYTIADLTNISLNQTLARTVNTSMTTIVVIASLILLGGSTTREFCTVLLIGILSGTYSSLFIASPFLVTFYKSKDNNLSDI